ncbi:uncharacterized protein LOC113755897 [Coffea eugenioides]|uniref:DUF4283 domain-containing protein n=1 Tax=Coffea arabica TaxID=13443 RepID=A0A6P6W3J6_COFAR|nr:uncharacterized protein LOC113728497 [Coffea arabica]XP_027155565.1 uncharacterized protein LOC113755897 [Coffea eugenioides]
MVDDLVKVFDRFDLSNKESSGITLDGVDEDIGKEECRKSLFGRIMGDRIANFTGVKNFVNQVWGFPKNMVAVELGANLFQFNFSDAMDMEKVLDGRPYTIDNQLLNVKVWEEGIDRRMEAFQNAHIWVQLWNLPVHWITKEIGIKIGGIFEAVEDIIIPLGGSKEGRHIKLKVVINISLPLLRGTVVKLNGMNIWVDFRYEKCPDFCYGCDLIGHNDKACRLKAGTNRGNPKPQYGAWMRALAKGTSPKKRTEY